MRRVDGLVLTVSVAAVVACSAGASGPGGGVGDDGGGGTSGTGTGGVPLGGTAGTIITGGTGGTIPSGGTNNGGTGNVCDSLDVSSKPVTPTVMILVDNSSSMFETMPPAWPILYSALMSPTDGAVKALEGKIHFGFMSYKGSTTISTEASETCADMTSQVLPALNNHAAIDEVYSAITWAPGTKWETPTGHAISRAAASLAAFTADPPGPKHILLVTDGNPNTCATLDPQCGQDVSIRAAQQAFAQGISLFAFGIGDIVAQPNNGCPTSARCGSLHLQDMANAGLGLPVQAPAENFKYEACNIGQLLTATYATAAETPGTAAFFTAANREQLLPQLTSLLAGVISCTLDMDAIVTGDAARGTVAITPENGMQRQIPVNDMTDGWVLEPNKFQVTLTGQACLDYKAGNADVTIEFPCGVAEPR